MSLYDGLDIGKEDGGSTKPVAGWSSSYKLLQSQLQAKKASSSQGRKSRHGGSTLAPVVDLKKSNDSELYFNQITGRIERSPIVSANIGSSPFIPSEPVPSLTGVADEYDPLRPNDYEDFVKKRKEQRHKEREEDLRKRDMDEDRHSRRRRDRDRDRD